MQTLVDLVGEIRPLLTTSGPAKGWPAGYGPKKKLTVPGERKLILPGDSKGLVPVLASSSPVLALTPGQSMVARLTLLSSPCVVFPLDPPESAELIQLGADPARFRHENPRCLALGVSVGVPNGAIAYGVARVVILENGLRMGSSSLLMFDDQWAEDADKIEDLLFELIRDAPESLQPAPEPNGRPWRTVVALLGGVDDPHRLPVNWRRQMRIAAGLRRVTLDIRPSPEAKRANVINDLQAKPPDALLVWVEWVSHPEAFVRPYLAARPDGMAELLGSAGSTMTFDDHIAELQMHLRQFVSLVGQREQQPVQVTWSQAAVLIEELVGPHFVLTGRARAMLATNPYPRPERMLDFTRRLAATAKLYRERSGQLGTSIAEFALAEQALEIAMHDRSLSVPMISMDGRDLDPRPHVKVDDYKTPDQCGRIYFAVDHVDFRFVVDHIGLHDYG